MALSLVSNSEDGISGQAVNATLEVQSPPGNKVISDDMTTSVKDTDQHLVERVQRGDRRAFDLLVIKYQARVMAVVSRYISDTHEVMDVAQEAFIKAYRALSSFRGESAFYTWLYRIAINCAKNYLVAQGRRPPGSDVAVDDAIYFNGGASLRDHDSPESQMQKDQLQKQINQAIQELPVDLRSAFTLREFDGMSYEDIAEIMQCPVGTVRSRIFRARDAIDARISPLLENRMRV